MKSEKIGVIDLGTNTFHLLIVMAEGADWKEYMRIRKFVELGKEGIEKIGDQALERAFTALADFKKILDQEEVKIIQANGTAALRTASNGQDFLDKVKSTLGIDVQLIDGKKEAALIYAGVRQAIPEMNQTGLIMDIGGGSVEFIIADVNGVIWAESFPIGVAVLFNGFHKSEPISPIEIETLKNFLHSTLAPLLKQLATNPCKFLIGASGTFDVLEKLLPIVRINRNCASIKPEDYPPLYAKFISSNLQQRLDWPGVPAKRAQLIVVALVLIDYILQSQPFQQILISKFAMKEGMIAQILSRS